MDTETKEKFVRLWNRYFPNAELPITLYYADDSGDAEVVQNPDEWRCLIAQLNDVRRGDSLAFGRDSIGCAGGQRYTGFSKALRPNFAHFLSYGIPGEIEGERYKKSPELVCELMKNWGEFTAPARYIVFKRWDRLQESEQPQVVIFYATPDALAGLFTLANFDESDPSGVFCPMSAGCATLVHYPFLEIHRDRPRAVVGMFDPSARPWVKPNVLTFAIPMPKFQRMIENMEESFLTTRTWDRVKARISS